MAVIDGATRQQDDHVGDSHLLEESILPVALSQRVIGNWGFVWIWIGMAVIIAGFQLGANGVTGASLITVVLTIMLANLALGVLMTLTADIGTEHGISFAVYLRAPFGTVGTHVPSISRGIVAALWFGIQTYLGALALNGIVAYATGFDHWGLWFGVFAVVQVINTAMGIRAVEKLANVAAPALILISIWMYYALDDIATVKGINIWTYKGTSELSLLVLFVANMAFWSTLAADIMNITRFLRVPTDARSFLSRNRNVLLAQLVALPATQGGIAIIGAAAFIATGDWNPVTVLQQSSTGVALISLLLLVVLAQWSTNTAANLIPAALTFVNAGAPRVSYAVGVWIAGLIGTLCMPWLILDHLFLFLGYYSAGLSAIAAIIVADYYLLRRRRLNVPHLYKAGGQFHYMRGFNPAGMIAWLAGGAAALAFLDYAYLVGFCVAFVVYLVLMKAWVLKQFPQAEMVSPEQGYLATSDGMSWVYTAGQGFARVRDTDATSVSREDL